MRYDRISDDFAVQLLCLEILGYQSDSRVHTIHNLLNQEKHHWLECLHVSQQMAPENVPLLHALLFDTLKIDRSTRVSADSFYQSLFEMLRRQRAFIERQHAMGYSFSPKADEALAPQASASQSFQALLECVAIS